MLTVCPDSHVKQLNLTFFLQKYFQNLNDWKLLTLTPEQGMTENDGPCGSSSLCLTQVSFQDVERWDYRSRDHSDMIDGFEEPLSQGTGLCQDQLDKQGF